MLGVGGAGGARDGCGGEASAEQPPPDTGVVHDTFPLGFAAP
jgi:hypothetical protein